MQITLLTLSGAQAILQVDPFITVEELKRLIVIHNIFPSDNMNLVLNGRVLNGYTTLIDNNITENSMIVINRAITAPQFLEQNSPEISDEWIEEESEPESQTSTDDEEEDTFFYEDAEPPKPKKPRKPRTPSKDPPNFDALVSELIELGFDITDARKSLRKTKYNVEKAATQLFTEQENRELEIFDEEETEVYSSGEEDEDEDFNEDSEEDFPSVPQYIPPPEEYMPLHYPIDQYTREDHAAIDRLCIQTSLPRQTVIQMYDACQKNERTTLLCLLDN